MVVIFLVCYFWQAIFLKSLLQHKPVVLQAQCLQSSTSPENANTNVNLQLLWPDLLMQNIHGTQLEKFPLRAIRSYAQQGRQFMMQTGRGCPAGEGTYSLTLSASGIRLNVLMDKMLAGIQGAEEPPTQGVFDVAAPPTSPRYLSLEQQRAERSMPTVCMRYIYIYIYIYIQI